MATDAQWGRAEIGTVVGFVLVLLSWGGLPGLLSKIPTGSDAPLHGVFAVLALVTGVSTALVLRQLLDGLWIRRIEDRATSRVRSMAAGAVELAGHAGAATLVSPVGGHSCVYWDYSIWRERADDELQQVCFFCSSEWPVPLYDKTGSVWIDSRNGEVIPSQSATTRLKSNRRNDPQMSRFLELHAVADGNLLIQERWIEPGAPLFLHGSCRPRAEAEATRERVARTADFARHMEAREAADPATVEEIALACVAPADRRRAFERELESRVAARTVDSEPFDGPALAAFQDAAKQASEQTLIEERRRFARWYLEAADGKADPAELALAAHVVGSPASPDQALLVGPDSAAGLPLDLTCMSETKILSRRRRFRAKMIRVGSALALASFVLGSLGAGTRFVVFSFAMLCVALSFALTVSCLMRTHWFGGTIRLHVPTARDRFPS